MPTTHATPALWTAGPAEIQTPLRRDDLRAMDNDGGLILLDPASGRVHDLGPTAALVWQYCDGQLSTQRVAECFAQTFEVDIETALEHVDRLIARLTERQLLGPRPNA
jgi:hypothetical protein